jgi:hypothetical protein
MEQPSTGLFDLHIDQEMSSYLKEASRWAKFLAIVGFVLCGLIVLVGFFAGTIFGYVFEKFGNQSAGYFGGGFFLVIYLLMALLYFFPCLYLYRFGSKAQLALKLNDANQMAISFRNLKSLFRFLGILTIIMVSLYALFFVIFMLTAAFTSQHLK